MIRITYLLFLFIIVGCIDLNHSHKITDNAIEIHELKYSRNRNHCFVTYSLDVGVRGKGLYKTLIPTMQLDKDLLQGHLPTGVIFREWVNDTILHIAYDPYLEGLSATGRNDLIATFKNKDTVSVYAVTFIVIERKTADNKSFVK